MYCVTFDTRCKSVKSLKVALFNYDDLPAIACKVKLEHDDNDLNGDSEEMLWSQPMLVQKTLCDYFGGMHAR